MVALLVAVCIDSPVLHGCERFRTDSETFNKSSKPAKDVQPEEPVTTESTGGWFGFDFNIGGFLKQVSCDVAEDFGVDVGLMGSVAQQTKRLLHTKYLCQTQNWRTERSPTALFLRVLCPRMENSTLESFAEKFAGVVTRNESREHARKRICGSNHPEDGGTSSLETKNITFAQKPLGPAVVKKKTDVCVSC